MGTTDPGSAREEAERLVATLLAGAKINKLFFLYIKFIKYS